jgi:hypothetical protein
LIYVNQTKREISASAFKSNQTQDPAVEINQTQNQLKFVCKTCDRRQAVHVHPSRSSAHAKSLPSNEIRVTLRSKQSSFPDGLPNLDARPNNLSFQ